MALLFSAGCGPDAPIYEVENLSPNALIIDVRTPSEYTSGHIDKAINIPYDVIGFKINAVTSEKDREVLLYCQSGRRSGIALKTLKDLGYRNAKNAGGYDALRKKLGQ